MISFCDLKTRNDLADFLEIQLNHLTYVLYIRKVESYYSTFEIPKRNGGSRTIDAPSGKLKHIQKKLANALSEYQNSIWQENGKRPNISHAFEKNKSIITNAFVHRNKRYILNIDLKDFFHSIHFGRVQGFFLKNKYFEVSQQVATVLAQLTCYNGHLPQGAPSSPIITNLICQILDYRLHKVAKKYRLDYTRYADDLTFSTNRKNFIIECDQIISDLSKEIEASGFQINHRKTRILYKDSRQSVTGLVVNQKLSVGREFCRNTKAMAHTLYAKGSFTIDASEGTMDQLEGRFTFIDQLDKYNNRLDVVNKHDNKNLSSREREYQKFLFFKYFFSNKLPTVVTEGKTDILYIKSALLKYANEYSRLVTKTPDGKLKFNLHFLNKSKRMTHFFGISKDGASGMFELYKYFSTTPKDTAYTNYLNFFKSTYNATPSNPIFFIFDNELGNDNKPLAKFVRNCQAKLKDIDLNNFKEKLYLQLLAGDNLYLLTNPLVNEKDESEIEDLFDAETLNTVLNGKTFCRAENEFNKDLHYSKEIFSKYVYKNYQNINFENFKSLLDNINNIAALYNEKRA